MYTEQDSSVTEILKDINSQGYARVTGLFDSTSVKQALSEVMSLHENYDYQVIKKLPRLDASQQTIYNLQNKNYFLLKLLLDNPLITRVLMGTLNDQWHKAIDLSEPNYILRSYSARNNVVAAPMHIDSFIPYQGQYPISMQVSIILEDQTLENGCTLVVPGSHQSGAYVEQSDREKCAPIESSAGDVVFWDSRIWHGTGDNRSGESRWSLIATFVRWWIKQGYQITSNLPQPIYKQLTDSQKAVMGYCSIPFDDESDGIDFKTGFDSLPKRV